MSLKLMIRRLRTAATALEELFSTEVTIDAKEMFAEKKIRKSMRAKRGPYKKHKKLHWTQTKAGKAKMSKLMKEKYAKGWRTR